MPAFILDGQRVEVKTAAELVSIMHANSYTPAADDKAYMMDVSDRTVLQSGDKIRTTSPEAFVNDLVLHRLLQVDPEWKPAPHAEPVVPMLKDVEVLVGSEYRDTLGHVSNELLLGFVEAVLYEARKRSGV